MALLFSRLPFACQGPDELAENWSTWVGDVFYEILPEHGFEIRDEQIYTAFQIATAMQHSGVHLAEAGLGTGKTFAYLVNGLIQARLSGRPVIISCASAVLQEQLAGPNGDIAVLAKILGIEIDSRVAKPFDQYVCDTKIEGLDLFAPKPGSKLAQALRWATKTQNGDRSEIPELPDLIWSKIAWDESLDCPNCPSRGYCRKTKAHNRHHQARDFIICDHEFFFADLWSRWEREAEGQRPFLPEYAGVIFDEGHKIFLPASRAAAKKLVRAELENMLLRLEKIPDARDSLLASVVAVEDAVEAFYQTLAGCLTGEGQAERLPVQISPKLKKEALALLKELRGLEFELETERSLFNEDLTPALLNLYDQRIAIFSQGARLLANDTGETIAWIEREDDSLRVMPRGLQEFLAEHLFKRRIPVILSSATLSTGGDFRYIASKLGLSGKGTAKLTTSSIGSPFDPEEQVLVYVPEEASSAHDKLVELLTLSRGRALVLTANLQEVKQIRTALKDELESLEFNVLWEDLADRGYLLQTFKHDIPSVLVGSSFWEGIDVPGEALSQVIIWSLPFPPTDPVLDSLRRTAAAQGQDPAEAVDYPEMALRLKQGCGRLIRSSTDRGVIAVLAPFYGTAWERRVLSVLPEGAPLTKKLRDVQAFF